MQIDESALTMVSEAEHVMRGRPHVYSDAPMHALLTLGAQHSPIDRSLRSPVIDPEPGSGRLLHSRKANSVSCDI